MQCVVASSSHKLWLWPGDVSARIRSSSCVSRRVNESSSSSSSGVGFSASGLLGAPAELGELRKWRQQQTAGLSGPGQSSAAAAAVVVHASLLMDPAVSLVRILVFYVLLQTGVAGPGGPARNQALADGVEEHTGAGKGPFDWVRKILMNENSEENRAKELAKVRSKWHSSTKGTLVRRYRVPSKAQGKKLLGAIMQLLSDDDTFRDVATHKGCQIRRENAHAETVCCHNVRALFDELPTPHLVVEITVFPAGPITEAHYEKAQKIEKVLKTGQSI